MPGGGRRGQAGRQAGRGRHQGAGAEVRSRHGGWRAVAAHRDLFGRVRVFPASVSSDADERWMAAALREAVAAGGAGEVPIGAVVVVGERVVAAAGNATIRTCDPTAHAEVLALRAAAQALGHHRLLGAQLYATVEPCAMCMGAAIQARVARLVFGCADPKAGAAGTLFDLANDARLNHRMVVTAGVGEEACRALVQEFFRTRRGA